ncbi:acetylornithine transaminase [Propionivibrio dicarboxylicus]|uniref:Acetylornithine aminotransferase n=1 Tax=Propionivibrio dicarboxylicus TaxID=83767 RepID=A0A1G8KY18_9RHOO|nr:acetylornithine transaminase [Propionivibrio dicarboxylicus]SDI48282.1 acetylornithine/N-succinyldiaminopimelate aminotransferase [Propionivibrio dicarboxylicus]
MEMSAPPVAALMPVAVRPPFVLVRGEGAYVIDDAGRRYLDWVQGWAVNCLGHSPAPVVQAIAAQAATLINPSPAFYNAPALELAGLLTENSGFDQVFFASSGAEANEGAIKLARKWGQLHKDGAHEIVTFVDAFHGRTLATMSASGKPGWDVLFRPQVDGFPKARLNDIDSVKACLGPKTVAIMLEPVQGEAGVIPATPEFLRALRDLCDAQGLLLIVDEVQTGCGRTGTLFAHTQAGIAPDIMTLGKGLGGGVPLAALLAKGAVSCFSPGDQGGTYCGNPLVCAAGSAVLKTLLGDGFLAQVRRAGERFAAGLAAISLAEGLGEVRQAGLLLALELGRASAAEVVELAREDGLLINAPRPHCLRLMPPLNSSDAEIDAGLALLQASIRRAHAAAGLA